MDQTLQHDPSRRHHRKRDPGSLLNRIGVIACVIGVVCIAASVIGQVAMPVSTDDREPHSTGTIGWVAREVDGEWVSPRQRVDERRITRQVSIATSLICDYEHWLGVPVRAVARIEHMVNQVIVPSNGTAPVIDGELLSSYAYVGYQLFREGTDNPQPHREGDLTVRLLREGRTGPVSAVHWPGVNLLVRRYALRPMMWLGLLLIAVWPSLVAWRSWRANRRRRRNLCTACGYPMLGATPDGRIITVCSECGLESAAAQSG